MAISSKVTAKANLQSFLIIPCTCTCTQLVDLDNNRNQSFQLTTQSEDRTYIGIWNNHRYSCQLTNFIITYETTKLMPVASCSKQICYILVWLQYTGLQQLASQLLCKNVYIAIYGGIAKVFLMIEWISSWGLINHTCMYTMKFNV